MTGDDQFANIVLFPEIGQPTWVELIIATYKEPRTHLHREIADPSLYKNIRDLALAHGIRPLSDYTAYLRLLPTSGLQLIDWSSSTATGMSVVVVPASLPTDGFSRVYGELASRPEILPTRMIWPVSI